MNNDRLKFRTPYYLPNPDGTNEFVAFAHWNATTGRPNMMVVWGNDEQCTGLRDKNGKLIYEGDIVRFVDVLGVAAEDTDVVVWEYGCFCLRDGEPFPNSELFEIVGNIHEQKDKQ